METGRGRMKEFLQKPVNNINLTVYSRRWKASSRRTEIVGGGAVTDSDARRSRQDNDVCAVTSHRHSHNKSHSFVERSSLVLFFCSIPPVKEIDPSDDDAHSEFQKEISEMIKKESIYARGCTGCN